MKKPSPEKPAGPFERLIWDMLIRFMRTYPLIGSMIGDGALRAHESRVRSLLPIAAKVPRAVALHWRDKLGKRIVLTQVYLGTTMRCTLRCDKCTMYLSDLKQRRDMPTGELLADIQALFSCVDYIYDFCIGGGEPLLHPDLDQVIRICADSGKTGNIKVLTNGTVMPNAKVLAAMREADVRVNLGKYQPADQPDIAQIRAVLAKNGIRHYDFPATSDYWVDTGRFGELKEGSPVERFSGCYSQLYNTYQSGQLHLCPQSAVLSYDGRLPECAGDYIDVRTISPAAFGAELKNLYKRNVISACSYCLGNNYRAPKIPAGVQRVPPTNGEASK